MTNVGDETHAALAGISAGRVDVLESALELREAQLEGAASTRSPSRWSGWPS